MANFGLRIEILLFFGITAAAAQTAAQATIDVDASKRIGTVSKYIFGQNLEHEHGAISAGHGLHSGGLWAEMLRDRKFEEGDVDGDGVADAWVPEERVANRYQELVNGRGPHVRYRIDHREWYGGGASQCIEVYGDGSQHASIYQVGLTFVRGRRYVFYVYLKHSGSGSAWVEFGARGVPAFARQEFTGVSGEWKKYTAEFTAPEDIREGRVRIAVQGAGVFWMDSASLMPADNVAGMRADVLAAIRPLQVPIVRYPGGCFADSYHWKDGVGDRDRRPERWSPFWDEWEPNDFGTDEFMALASASGFDAHITANYLSGTPQEAAGWVEYANGSAETPMGRLRARNGHPAPYGIKLWAVGNEAQQLCSDAYFPRNDVKRYAARFQEYRKAILAKDPSVRVMASGAPPGPLEWNHDVLEQVPDADLLGFSIYTGEGGRRDDFDTKIMDLNHFYEHVAAEPVDFERVLGGVAQSAGELLPRRPFLAVTEFQSWWLTERVDADLRLANALYVAGVYHALLRRAKQVSIAELESIVNVQGIIEVGQNSVKLTPEYFACMLYRQHTGDFVLEAATKSPAAEFNATLPALDAAATLSAGGKVLYLSVVNRSAGSGVAASVRFHGWAPAAGAAARVLELNGKDKVAANPFGSTENVQIREKSAPVTGTLFSYVFPAHSVTVIEFPGSAQNGGAR